MAKIKITDLPKDQKISTKEMKKVVGGIIGDVGMPRFIRSPLRTPGIYGSAPVDPPPPTGGGPKKDIRA